MSDKRLIEDFLPIQAIGESCKDEESYKKSRFGRPFGHPHQIHKWWATRPLVACRAAVYSELVPANRFIPDNGPDNKKQSLGRANAAKFIGRLCKYPGNPDVIKEAQLHILEAHAERLTRETGDRVRVEDIEEGRAPRPKVLDIFAGSGAIPLEALHLGCEAYALDLNPVAHIIELCTLVYPQKYGEPDADAKGMTGKNGTWGGLASEVRYWGDWVLKRVKAEIGDLYPPIPDPKVAKSKVILGRAQTELTGKGFEKLGQQESSTETPTGFLTPLAYLWTRTVQCKNPMCGATVPLVLQTWLCKKKGRFVALKMIAPRGKKTVRFQVIEATNEKSLGFDPSSFSKGGNATCPFCGTVADLKYVKAQGCAKQMGQQMMAIVCAHPAKKGKIYLSASDYGGYVPDGNVLRKRIDELCNRIGTTVPSEPIEARMTGGICLPYGLITFGDLFGDRQMLCLLTFAEVVREAENEILRAGHSEPHSRSVVTCLGMVNDTLADYSSSLCHWKSTTQQLVHTFSRQALPMVWDFPEPNPFGGASGDWREMLKKIQAVIARHEGRAGVVFRGNATELPWPDASFDAVITDPPYYDNVDYAKLADFFYVWLKRTIGHLYPEHFASEGTPKKAEAVADPVRHDGSRAKAKTAYEHMMAQSFAEASRVLKPNGQLTVVYAHKTTLGWSTLVDALRRAGFEVTEAWPINTEMKSRLLAMDSAALASSIFLVARKREGKEIGSYEKEVRPELERIVRERVDTLWKMGITGADLVIAAVGAGMRAFTQYAKVELPNGDEVAPERFLSEVEGVVQDVILEYLFGSRSSISAVDPVTRFYVLWRYAYGSIEINAGEAIVFSYPLHVELDGSQGLSNGSAPLLEKNGNKYSLQDFAVRGGNKGLGIEAHFGLSAPSLIDVLHRLLWLMENRISEIPKFLDASAPETERLRLVAQALAGSRLEGGGTLVTTDAEHVALQKLVSNWGSIIKVDLIRRK